MLLIANDYPKNYYSDPSKRENIVNWNEFSYIRPRRILTSKKHNFFHCLLKDSLNQKTFKAQEYLGERGSLVLLHRITLTQEIKFYQEAFSLLKKSRAFPIDLLTISHIFPIIYSVLTLEYNDKLSISISRDWNAIFP